MTEILTESFCERCGTRYTFESARPKSRLKGVRVLSRGLKNFVLSDDTSIDEAMAAARSESDREGTAHQLDAFHKTFNFCMGCRQYTCPNCWNEPEARCLSCAPLELPAVPVRLEDLAVFGGSGLIGESELIGTPAPANGAGAHEHETSPESVQANAAAALAPDELAAPEPVTADADLAPEAVLVEADASQAGVASETDAAEIDTAELDAAGKLAAQTTGLLKRFRPGQNLDDELAAFELERTESAQGVAAGPSDTQEPMVESIVEEAAATASTEPGPGQTIEVPAAATAAPEPEPEPLAAAPAAADVVEQPTWRISAPDPGGAAPLAPSSEPGTSIPLQASAAQTNSSGEPQWPARPQRPSAPAAGLPFLGRPAAPEGGIEALWAASNQELVTAVAPTGKPTASGIQPCISCGLSLSATARFCRRCGTLQGR